MSRTNQRTLPGMAGMEPRKANITGLPAEQKRHNGEHLEQRALFTFLRTFRHLHPRFGLIHSSLNGFFRVPRQRAEAVESGCLAGVWDCCVPFPRVVGGVVSGCLYIEMKYGTGKLTAEQTAFRDALMTQNTFIVAYSWTEAVRAIVDYLGIVDPRIEVYLVDNARATVPKGTPAT